MEQAFQTLNWMNVMPLQVPPLQPRRPRNTCGDLSEIIPGLSLTCQETARSWPELQLRGVRLILTMNAEASDPPFVVSTGASIYEHFSSYTHSPLGSGDAFVEQLQADLWRPATAATADAACPPMYVRNIPAADSPSYNLSQHFDEMCCLIELVMVARAELEQLDARNAAASQPPPQDEVQHATSHPPPPPSPALLPSVVVHCMAGISRSSTIVMAYLMKKSRASSSDVLQFVTATRPVVHPNVGFRTQLAHWEQCSYHRLYSPKSATRIGVDMASRPAAELRKLVANMLRLVLLTSLMAQDRQHLPVVLAVLQSRGVLSAADIRGTFRNVVSQQIEDEEFVDAPGMFGNVAELVAAMQMQCPEPLLLLLPSNSNATSEGSPTRRTSASDESGTFVSHQQRSTPVLHPSGRLVCSADFHFEMLQVLVDRPQCDAWVTCEAAMGFLHHILRVAPPATADGPPTSTTSVRLGDTLVAVGMPPAMQLPFPVLGLLAKYAEGFCDCQLWLAVEHDPVQSLALLRRRFLVCRADGALAAYGTKDLVRWSSPFAAPLRQDIEIEMFEALEAEDAGEAAWATLQAKLEAAAVASVAAAAAASSPPCAALDLEQALLARLEAKCLSAAEVIFMFQHPLDGEAFLARLRHAVRRAFRQHSSDVEDGTELVGSPVAPK